MIIKRILIEKLHGKNDYDVEFDSQLTFLHGANGCGKTTILNILVSIITGKLYNLADYKFKIIELLYSDSRSEKGSIRIEMKNEKTDEIEWEVTFDNQTYLVDDVDNLKERLFRKSEDERIERVFASMYPFVKDIVEKFNYVYLPLSRYGYERFDDYDYYRYSHLRRHYYRIQDNPYNSYLNDSLRYVSDLVRNSCMDINVRENRTNDEFRKQVLSSMISVSSDMRISQIIREIDECKWTVVMKSKEAYEKTLMDIGVYDKLENDIEVFFRDFKNAYDDYVKQKNKNESSSSIRIDLAWQYAQFKKIQNIAELAKKNEKIKDEIRQPREMFLEVINDFFSSSGTHKKIKINNEGQIYFDTTNGKLELSALSSGEKQIIITFASMIFGLRGEKKGIFIVDEPEASLHLEWQSKFVPSIIKINKNLQLIFATHSPELIGEYRNKAYRL